MNRAEAEKALRQSRPIVRARSGGVCERCRKNPAREVHHRVGKGSGGTNRVELNQPAALVHLCPGCHRWATEHPDDARLTGWVVKRSTSLPLSQISLTDPEGRVFRLTNDGGYDPVPDFADIFRSTR